MDIHSATASVRDIRGPQDASRNPRLHDLSCDIREAEIASLEAMRETNVIDAELIQNRRVQVIEVNGIAHDRPPISSVSP